VVKALWHEAEIYPEQRNNTLVLAGEQKEQLRLFGQGGNGVQ